MDKDASVSARSERLANVTFDDLLAAMNDEAAYLRRHPHDAGAVEDTKRALAALVEFTHRELAATLTTSSAELTAPSSA